jgi:hypothetical protein
MRYRVIVLAESRAVRNGGLRHIRDRGGTPRTHVTAGGPQVLACLGLGVTCSGRTPWVLRLPNGGYGQARLLYAISRIDKVSMQNRYRIVESILVSI